MEGTADVGTMPQTADEATNTRESQALNRFGRAGFGNDLAIAIRTQWENDMLRNQMDAMEQAHQTALQRQTAVNIEVARQCDASINKWKIFSFLLALCLLANGMLAYFNAELWAFLADVAYQRLLQVNVLTKAAYQRELQFNALNDKIEYLIDILCIVHKSKDTVCVLDSHWFANLDP